MAITRYRHFWSSKLEFAPIGGSSANGDLADPGAGISDFNMTGILKSYSPPRIVREVRQIETGKYLNERILGRLLPEETNFSIVMPSDFEAFYVYNGDYQFEIIEELHGNQERLIRYVVDEVQGTLFDREWSDFMQNGQDRDITLHFILKKYTRTFTNHMDGGDLTGAQATASNNVKVIDIDLTSTPQKFNTIGRGMPAATSGNDRFTVADNVGMFLGNTQIITP